MVWLRAGSDGGGKHTRRRNKKVRDFTHFLTHRSTLLYMFRYQKKIRTNKGTQCSVLFGLGSTARTPPAFKTLNNRLRAMMMMVVAGLSCRSIQRPASLPPSCRASLPCFLTSSHPPVESYRQTDRQADCEEKMVMQQRRSLAARKRKEGHKRRTSAKRRPRPPARARSPNMNTCAHKRELECTALCVHSIKRPVL